MLINGGSKTMQPPVPEDIRNILNQLRDQLQEIREELQRLWFHLPTPENLLYQRGFSVIASNPHEFLLLPPGGTRLETDRYYRLLRRYSFRLFLRDVIRFKDKLELQRLLHYCSPAKANRYLQALVELSIVRPLGDGTFAYLANPAVSSFGDTLEWFVAETLSREFRIPSCWGLSVTGLGQGGDFDVIGALAGKLVYIETKASPPKNLHMDVVQGFIRRVRQLRPELAILLVDTHLRMEDKINKMVRVAFREVRPSATDFESATVARGVFRMGPGLYTCNSKPAIHKNLRLCIRDFLSLETGRDGKDIAH